MTLLEWIIELSVMLDEELNDGSSLESALEWFGNLPPEVLERLNLMAREKPSLKNFLDIGKALLDDSDEIGSEYG